MRSINEYVKLVEEKFTEDHEITGISIPECIDFIVDNAFFNDEILYQSIDPLKNKLEILVKEKKS